MAAIVAGALLMRGSDSGVAETMRAAGWSEERGGAPRTSGKRLRGSSLSRRGPVRFFGACTRRGGGGVRVSFTTGIDLERITEIEQLVLT